MQQRAAIDPRHLFFGLLAATLIFRFWLAAVTPITGDEAYFIWWGQFPDWGYYDHPPMIGWWLAALLKVSAAVWWLRLPVILQPAILAWAVAAFLRHPLPRVAWWTAILVLLAPAHVWNVFITTDTPLVYCSVFSGLAWLRARRAEDVGRSARRWYLLCGLLLAGAVLSKYFAALLGFAYLVDTLWRPQRRKFAGLALAYAPVVPALLLMAWWNAGHCWPNFMFNFINRHGDAGLSWRTPLLYLGMLVYLFTPPACWLLLRGQPVGRQGLQRGERRTLILLALVPFLLFAALSLVKTIGMHWVLSFIPFVLIFLACALPPETLRRLALFFVGFAALHAGVIIAIAQLPLETWQRTRWYDGIVLTVEAPKLLDQLEPYADYEWMMDGYSNAVTLGFNTYARSRNGQPHYIGVFGEASSHARHDDIMTDFRRLAGRNILILRKTAPATGEYEPYFAHVEYKRFMLRGVEFYIVLGQGFDYAVYRDRVLAKVRQKYYVIPAFLPQTACYFTEKYFSDPSPVPLPRGERVTEVRG